MPKQIIQTPMRWVTKEVAQHLRASARSVQNYRDKEGLPYLKINARKILYDPEAVISWARKKENRTGITNRSRKKFAVRIGKEIAPRKWNQTR